MCGLLFAKRRDKHPVKKALLKRYNTQASRGRRGFGFIALKEGRVTEVQRFETEHAAERAVKDSNSSEILFHHRLPTSTPNHEDMTHPIVVKNPELEFDYYLIHNGVLRNEHTLKTKHEKLGYEYTTAMQEVTSIRTRNNHKELSTVDKFNDSEALAIEVARYLDGKSDEIDAVGTIAFICFKTDKEGNVVSLSYGHNDGNPLVVENNGDLFFVKSEGDGEKVPVDTLYTMDYKTNNITAKFVRIGRTSFQVAATDPWPALPHRAGFGANRDDERTSGIVSPIQMRDRNLDWGDNADDYLNRSGEIPTIDYEVPNYNNSEDYLADLAEEIEALKRDIEECDASLLRPILSNEERQYYEEYKDECQDVMSEKIKEHRRLEDRLAGSGQ